MSYNKTIEKQQVNLDTLTVEYLDEDAKTDDYAQEIIEDTLSEY